MKHVDLSFKPVQLDLLADETYIAEGNREMRMYRVTNLMYSIIRRMAERDDECARVVEHVERG